MQALESRTLMAFSPLNHSPDLTGGSAVSRVDPSTGDIYVATSEQVSGGYHSIAITRFTSSGSIDTTWGSSGTLTLTQWGQFLSDPQGSDDVPDAIAMQDDNIVVVGSSTAWGMVAAEVTTSGTVNWQTDHIIQQPGVAAAVDFDENGNIYVAGNDGGSDMVVAKLEDSTGVLNTGFNSGGTKPGTEKISVSGSTTVTVTSIVANNHPDDRVYVGGYTEYSIGGGTASDFTIACVDRGGGLKSGFGTDGSGIVRTNFAACNPNACVGYSNDALYSLAEWEDSSSNDYLYAAGATNAEGSTSSAIARYTLNGTGTDGKPDDTWGFGNGDSAHSGRLIDRAGIATGIILPGGMTGNGKFVVSGIDDGDFYVDSYNPDGSYYDGFSSGTSYEESGTFGGTTQSLDSVNAAPSGNVEISGVNTTACSYDIGLAEYSFS